MNSIVYLVVAICLLVTVLLFFASSKSNLAKQRVVYRPGKGGYVSEFTQFIKSHLRLHPEAVADQRVGWARYWEPQIASGSQRPTNEDVVVENDHLGTISKDD